MRSSSLKTSQKVDNRTIFSLVGHMHGQMTQVTHAPDSQSEEIGAYEDMIV